MSWSIKRRFLITSLAVTTAALVLAATFLFLLFQRDFKARVHTEIHNQLMQLLSGIELDQLGKPQIPDMTDPRFREPLSGLYWQVETDNGDIQRSRSLWDETLSTGDGSWQDIEEPEVFPGPFGEPVLIHSRLIIMGDPPRRRQLRVLIAVNESEITVPAQTFAFNLAIAMGVLAIAISVISATQLRMIMKPLNNLRRSVRDIRDGRAARVSGAYPVEIEPVVGKLNGLLDQRDIMIERARSRAGNFAHGLKTPLTVIDTLLPDLRAGGQHESANEIGRQTAQLRNHVNRELARARMAAGHGEPVGDVAAILEELIKTMRKLPRGNNIAFKISAPANQSVRMDRDDFIEFTANIIDNARKWARSSVDICIVRAGTKIVLTISDDGPGIPGELMANALERGRRLDEATEGSGIGLAIVRDIAEAYGISPSFRSSDTGGLQFHTNLPT